MIIFSVIASVPTFFLRPVFLSWFEGHNRFISFGLPTLLTACIFGITGILLLVIFKDESAVAIVNKVRRRK